MSALRDYAALFSDLADDVGNDLETLMQQRPAAGPALGVWQLQMSRLSSKANDLQNIAGQLFNLDAQDLLQSVSSQLDDIKDATASAQRTIKTIHEINALFDLLGKFITLGTSVVGLVADPVNGISDVASSFEDLKKSADAYKEAKA